MAIDRIDKVLQIGLGLGVDAVLVQRDLLSFERGEEALRQRILVRITL